MIVQENRTLNNLFATFPGANGTTVGKRRIGKNKRTQNVDLTEVGLFLKKDLNHTYSGFLRAYDDGKMDGFNEVKYTVGNKAEGTAPYVYVNPSQIVPYWTLAQQYSLAAAMFTTQGSASFTAHQDLIRGGTFIDSTHSLIDNPKYGNKAWGCDSSADTVTSLITTDLQLQKGAGPFPCTTQFPASGSGYATLRDLLDAQSSLVEVLHAGDRRSRRYLERVRRHRTRPQRTGVEHQRFVAGNQRLERHRERKSSGGFLGDPRRPELRSSKQRHGHRTVVGRNGR